MLWLPFLKCTIQWRKSLRPAQHWFVWAIAIFHISQLFRHLSNWESVEFSKACKGFSMDYECSEKKKMSNKYMKMSEKFNIYFVINTHCRLIARRQHLPVFNFNLMKTLGIFKSNLVKIYNSLIFLGMWIWERDYIQPLRNENKTKMWKDFPHLRMS